MKNPPLRTVIIGHRGSGKTSFLKRTLHYHREAGLNVTCIDLDEYIERESEKRIDEIFASQGEEAFRQLELECFSQLDKETRSSPIPVFISLGAGFPPSSIPDDWRAIWLSHATDSQGRVFFDRRSLHATLSPLQEFQERFTAREERFQVLADEMLLVDEGLDRPDQAESDFILGRFQNLGGAITLHPHQFARIESLKTWMRSRLAWGVQYFELRDDLLSEEQMQKAIDMVPGDRLLVSFRDERRTEATKSLIAEGNILFDWPVERGICSIGASRVLSLHSRAPGKSVEETLAQLSGNTILKAALPIFNFDELLEGNRWQEADPERRSFLPMSHDGRWEWYRRLTAYRSPLSFIREGNGSAPDQPTLLQWARQCFISKNPPFPPFPKGGHGGEKYFAAVLGDPVSHSRTPIEHEEFFGKKGSAVYAIRVSEEEWKRGALDQLQSLGLRWAAVTAPLKRLAFEMSLSHSEQDKKLEAINTIQWDEAKKHWGGTNTDIDGLRDVLMNHEPPEPIAVWGGGGTLGVIKSLLPKTFFFSARTGENRESGGVNSDAYQPKTVIWAGGRSRDEHCPPSSWRPELIIDLNYTDDSPGKEFALERGARYISGLTMFKGQAARQRTFWEES